MKDPQLRDKHAKLALSRRDFIRGGIYGGLGLSLFQGPPAIASPDAESAIADFSELLPADSNGLMLPPGFTSRIIAVSGQAVSGTEYVWHDAPDGGATFASEDGGWVYVSNAELNSGAGGVSAIRCDASGNIIDAYSILTGTTRNCAGGPTPWGTWLSCEETGNGQIWECKPFEPGSQGIAKPHMGRFNHEAAAVDPIDQVIYLTEDRTDGLLYRFVPDKYPDLSRGTLEAAEILDPLELGAIAPGQTRNLSWHAVPNPLSGKSNPQTRHQVSAATIFNGGEGCWYESGLIYFSTKGDNRVWKINTQKQQISILYDLASSNTPELSGVDNVYVSPNRDVYVAEDGGNMQIVGLTDSGIVKPVVEIPNVSGSEITGPALSPDGRRLYFSSQRGPGITYEVSGPWLKQPTRPRLPARSGIGGAILAASLYALTS